MSTAQKIRLAAKSLFARNGWEGTSLTDIAKQVGIKKPSIYNHYASKEEIFFTVLDEVLNEYIQFVHRTLERLQTKSSEEKLARLLQELCLTYMGKGESFMLSKRIIAFPPDILKDELKEKIAAGDAIVTNQIEALFQKGIDVGEIKPMNIQHLMTAYYCIIDGMSMYWLYSEDKTMIQEHLTSTWAIFWEGIRKK